MTAIMVVYMDITDSGWIKPYFAAVPAILAEYGGVSVAASRDIRHVEGDIDAPDRMAIFRFPSLDDIEHFFADERYKPFLEARREGARSQIFVFENGVVNGELL
jgi:uncharacterized protein (DUF1330 family)